MFNIQKLRCNFQGSMLSKSINTLILFSVVYCICEAYNFVFIMHQSNHTQQGMNNALLTAITEDNAGEVAALLRRGADPNAHEGYMVEEVNSTGWPSHLPLQWHRLVYGSKQHWIASKETALNAALSRVADMEIVPANPVIVELLVRAGAGVNAEGNNGWFPLLEAADTKQCGLVKLLLDHGAKPNKVDTVRGSALSLAAARGDAATVKLLLQKGANPNLANAYGWTPLMCAVQSHSEEAVLLLLKSGASPQPKNSLGESALSLAVSEGLPTIERILRKQ